MYGGVVKLTHEMKRVLEGSLEVKWNGGGPYCENGKFDQRVHIPKMLTPSHGYTLGTCEGVDGGSIM